MDVIAHLPARIPSHLVDEFLKRVPFVSDEISTFRLAAEGTQVLFQVREGAEARADTIAAHIAEVAGKLCSADPAPRVRVVASQPRLPSSFDADPHVLLERTGELVRFGRGRYGLGPRMTALVAALDRRLCRMAGGFHSTACAFPSLIGADTLDRCRYIRNFPTALTLVTHLREDHARLREFASTARWDGGGLTVDAASLSRVDCLLAPAVCFHWYAALADSRLEGSRSITAVGKCFRYESTNLTGLERLWDFTMREFVFVGAREYVLEQRERCIAACISLMDQLGLAYEISTATDPFFVDGYALQAAYQQGFELKLELLLPLPYAGRNVAAGSLNYHQDFFGRSLAIGFDGAPAGGIARRARVISSASCASAPRSRRASSGPRSARA